MQNKKNNCVWIGNIRAKVAVLVDGSTLTIFVEWCDYIAIDFPKTFAVFPENLVEVSITDWVYEKIQRLGYI